MPTRDEPIYIRVEGEHILGTLISPGALSPGVLFVHGWGGDQRQYLARARAITELGCVCLTFDLRGHAQTQTQHETVSREESLRDILAAYDFLAAQPNVDSDSIAVVGSSYGGYLAALLSNVRRVRWLALHVPALYLDDEWLLPKNQLNRDTLRAYRNSYVPPESNRALKACADFGGDVLIVEAEHDTFIPHSTIMSYRSAFRRSHSLTHRILDGADHALTEKSAQRAYTSILVNWVTEMVTGARMGNPRPVP